MLCGMSEFLATGSHPQDDVNPRTLQGKDVNRRMVFVAFESGIGKEGVAKFPALIRKSSFYILVHRSYNLTYISLILT